MKSLRLLPAVALLSTLAACGGGSSNGNPSGPSSTPPTLTKPTPDAPADGEQLDTVRPTLRIVNGTSNQTATKMYEFQVSDNSSFTPSANETPSLASLVSSPAIAEDASGKTSYPLQQDLQPTTKYYWRARLVQSNTNSEWSEVRSFKTKPIGYNKPGALYDPLFTGETVGQIGGSGNITWVRGQGIKLNDVLAYVVYELPQTYSSGEMSVEVTNLASGGAPGKARIISMLDRLGSKASSSRYSFNLQYRGVGGVPQDCITWKAVLGYNDHSVEAQVSRFSQIYILDPAKVYLWQAFWTPTSFRVVVREGGLTGPVLYDQENQAEAPSNWNPSKMYAFLGTNNGAFIRNDGSRVDMIARNLWVGSTPRPSTLGNAIEPLR